MTATEVPTKRRVRLRAVALPAEHGGWSFLLEPLVLGLWLAPSIAGVWLALGAIAAFLAHHPLKLALSDRRAAKPKPRTVWARRFALLYGTVAAGSLALAIYTALHPFWLPLLLAAPLALAQLYYESGKRARELAAELAGATALGVTVAAIALLGGRELGVALALWGILALRSISAIVYVRVRLRIMRARLRNMRGKPANATAVYVVHLGGLLAVAGLAWVELAPWLATLAFVVLFARAGWGLSARSRAVPVKIVGVQEVSYGLLTVIIVALGYIFNN